MEKGAGGHGRRVAAKALGDDTGNWVPTIVMGGIGSAEDGEIARVPLGHESCVVG